MTNTEHPGSCTALDQLQALTCDFVKLDTLGRERGLSRQIAEVKKIADGGDLALKDSDFGRRLAGIAEQVAQTSFQTTSGVVLPWTGSYTIAVLGGANGEILGLTAKPVDKVYETYGANLLAQALTNALIRVHLVKAGFENGLDAPDIFEYVAKLCVTPDHNLHMGEAVYHHTQLDPSVVNNWTGIVVGASGCETTIDYRQSLAGDMLDPNKSEGFVAGYLNMVFAQLVAKRLGKPNSKHENEISEPRFLSTLRISH